MNRPLQGELGDALSAVLGDMQQSITQLTQVLENERTALNAGNSDALGEAGAGKQKLMLQLEQLDAERQQLSREAPAAAARLDATWAQVLQALRRCQQLNQSNGRAVNQRLGQVRQALSILTGHAGEAGLYGPTCGLRGSLRSQVLAQA
jgi:flagella synthesis protein FlgN